MVTHVNMSTILDRYRVEHLADDHRVAMARVGKAAAGRLLVDGDVGVNGNDLARWNRRGSRCRRPLEV
jgi:hypothetical protein